MTPEAEAEATGGSKLGSRLVFREATKVCTEDERTTCRTGDTLQSKGPQEDFNSTANEWSEW